MWNQRQQLRRQALLEERAHAMRHQPTESEAKLWEALRGRQLGVHFKRQVPIGEFIVERRANSRAFGLAQSSVASVHMYQLSSSPK